MGEGNLQLYYILPILYICCLHCYCKNPIIIEKFKITTQFSDIVPQIPSNKNIIYKLGYLSAQGTQESLDEASKIIGYNFTNYEELLNFCNSLDEHIYTLFTKFWSLINFVNILIVFGIVGMMITFWPAMYTICAPLTELLGGNIAFFKIKNSEGIDCVCH
jgi:hypothetical protein